jgi:hypothetical protein
MAYRLQPSVSGRWYESGSEPFVAMMQTTDLRNGHDSSHPAWLDGATVRAILIERQMRAGALVIVHIRGQDAAQMALVEDHKVIQALTTNRTDHALRSQGGQPHIEKQISTGEPKGIGALVLGGLVHRVICHSASQGPDDSERLHPPDVSEGIRDERERR